MHAQTVITWWDACLRGVYRLLVRPPNGIPKKNWWLYFSFDGVDPSAEKDQTGQENFGNVVHIKWSTTQVVEDGDA